MSLLADFHECVRALQRVVALVGAGLSVLLGLPVFWGLQGLWHNYNMIDLATPDAFYSNPALVWLFYAWRRHQALAAQPNAGHRVLAALLRRRNYVTISQNVDGLLARAGHSPKLLHDIHGSLFELRCTNFACNYVDHSDADPLTPALGRVAGQHSGQLEVAEEDLPHCPACGWLLRPGVVWFGELLPLRTLDRIDQFLEAGHTDLILVIGTSGTVYPANGYVDLVRLRGGRVAIFNTDIDKEYIEGKVPGTFAFVGDAAETLPVALAPLLENATA